jgi:nicotinate-nucleotide pyrophosphorylase (carboxylating)
VQDLNQLSLSDLLPALSVNDAITRLLAIAVEEDLGPGAQPGDVTSQCSIPPDRWADGLLVAREPGVLSGIAILPQVMSMLAAEGQVSFRAQDGDRIRAGQTVAMLTAPMYQVLRAERLMLNLIGRMSGIATRAAEFVKAVEGTKAVVLDTRKTTPGWRALEKYAVRCGGGTLHRIGLHDAVLFKDNHIFGVTPKELPAWVAAASDRARRAAEHVGELLRFVELEVTSIEQLDWLFRAGVCIPGSPAGVDIILLDNMSPELLRKAVEMRSRFGGDQSKVQFEASGGVRLDTIRAIAETGVERISVGGLTHHAVSLDFSMDVQDTPAPNR